MGERAELVDNNKEQTIANLVRVLERRGYGELRVRCLEEFAGRRPASIHWEGADAHFAPDIVARRKGMDVLFQVETTATLSHASTAEKIALFAAFAKHFRLQFCLVVPESCRREGVRELLAAHADERFTRLLHLS